MEQQELEGILMPSSTNSVESSHSLVSRASGSIRKFFHRKAKSRSSLHLAEEDAHSINSSEEHHLGFDASTSIEEPANNTHRTPFTRERHRTFSFGPRSRKISLADDGHHLLSKRQTDNMRKPSENKASPSKKPSTPEPKSTPPSTHRKVSSYVSYPVHQRAKAPVILRDLDATRKLLETILEMPSGRRSLGRVSRVSKAFYAASMPLLWRDLSSVVPLIGLFPSHLLKKPRRPGLGFLETPQKNDYEAWHQYSTHVRSLTYNEGMNTVASNVFEVIKDSRPQANLLPNLEQLIWKASTPSGLQRASIFLTPSLQSVHLFGQATGAFLTELCQCTGVRLQKFTLSSPIALPDNLPTLISQRGLTYVELAAPGALSRDIGEWLARLPFLGELKLDLTGRSVIAVEGFFDGGLEADFSTLQRLTLTGEASCISFFLRHLTSPLITHMDLVIEDPPDAADWRDLCDGISERFSQTLQSLRITATGSSRFADLVRSTSRAEPTGKHLPLNHLKSMVSLVRLEVDLPESFIFYDGDVAHLSDECPKLEVLKLCPSARFSTGTTGPSLTLAGIAPLTRQCRRLHTLAVVMSAPGAQDIGIRGSLASSRSLMRLNVGHSWIADPLQTAILMSQLAPHLETLKWFQERNRAGYVESRAEGWRRAYEILPHVQEVRLRERTESGAEMLKRERREKNEALRRENEKVESLRREREEREELIRRERDSLLVSLRELEDRLRERDGAVREERQLREEALRRERELREEALRQEREHWAEMANEAAALAAAAKPTLAEKEVDATPATNSVAVMAQPETPERLKFAPELVVVQAVAPAASTEVNITQVSADTAVDASPLVVDTRSSSRSPSIESSPTLSNFSIEGEEKHKYRPREIHTKPGAAAVVMSRQDTTESSSMSDLDYAIHSWNPATFIVRRLASIAHAVPNMPSLMPSMPSMTTMKPVQQGRDALLFGFRLLVLAPLYVPIRVLDMTITALHAHAVHHEQEDEDDAVEYDMTGVEKGAPGENHKTHGVIPSVRA